MENANDHPFKVAIVKDTEGLFANSHPYKVSLEGGGGYEARVVDELPDEGEVGYIYLVLKEETAEGDIYDEYIWALQSDGETYGWEHLGATNEVTIKLYDTEGTNTDGAATQRLVTDLKGKIKTLSTADYNDPADNPTRVNIVLLPMGIYYCPSGVALRDGSSSVSVGSGGITFIKAPGGPYGHVLVVFKTNVATSDTAYGAGAIYQGGSTLNSSIHNVLSLNQSYGGTSFSNVSSDRLLTTQAGAGILTTLDNRIVTNSSSQGGSTSDNRIGQLRTYGGRLYYNYRRYYQSGWRVVWKEIGGGYTQDEYNALWENA